MSRIHISRDRQNLGQFGPEEVAVGLKSGRFLPTDLAWRDGMESWQPLSTFSDLPEVSTPEPEVTPMMAPGTEILEPAAPASPTPPWEEEKPVLTRLVDTIQKVLLSPFEAFANVPDDSGVLRSIWFMVLVGWPAMIVSVVYQIVMEMLGSSGDAEALEPVYLIVICAVFVVFVPFLLVVGAFISSAIFHGILMMLGAASRSFWTTFRVVAYVNGATMVLLLVPLCGSFAQSIWAVVALLIGLKAAHQTTWVNAIVTIFLPVVICCGLLIAAFSLGYHQFMQP